MDSEVVAAKLESLRRCVGRIRDKTPDAVETLAADYDLQDIISVNLERAVQACVDIAAHLIADSEATPPATMAAGFTALHSLGILPEELAQRRSELKDSPMLRPYEVFGTAAGIDEEGKFMALVLMHRDSGLANENVALLRQRVEETESVQWEVPWTELVDEIEVRSEGYRTEHGRGVTSDDLVDLRTATVITVEIASDLSTPEPPGRLTIEASRMGEFDG